MIITEIVANRLEMHYDESKDGETFLISLISDAGNTQICRINLDTLPALKNFTDLCLQFMSKCKQEREQNSQIAQVQSRPKVVQ